MKDYKKLEKHPCLCCYPNPTKTFSWYKKLLNRIYRRKQKIELKNDRI